MTHIHKSVYLIRSIANMENISREEDFNCLDENLSRDSISEEYWLIRLSGEQYISSGIAMSVIMTLMFIVGVTWNLIVIVIILVKRLCHIPSVLLLLDMAITDLLFCLLIMPFSIVAGFAEEYIFGNSDYTRCQFCKFNHFFIYLSVKIIFNRQTNIPQKATSLSFTDRCKDFLILFAWIMTFVLALPPLFDFGEITYDFKLTGIYFATFVGATTNYHSHHGFHTTVCYCYHCHECVDSLYNNKLKNQETMEAFDNASRERKHLTFKQQFIIARIFAAINIVNFIAWLPIFIRKSTGNDIWSSSRAGSPHSVIHVPASVSPRSARFTG